MKDLTQTNHRFASFKLQPADYHHIDQTITHLIDKTCNDTKRIQYDRAWKLMAGKQHLRIYRKLQSESTPQTPSESGTTDTPSSSGSDLNPGADPGIRIVHLNPQQKLLGCIPGTVEDFLCGVYACTDTEWKQSSERILNGALRSHTVSQIQVPTTSDPFQTRTIRWAMRSQKSIPSIFVRQRDFAFVEATGWKIDSDGQRVGYYVIQSIRHPDVPELQNVCRAELSVCLIVTSNESRSISVHGLAAFDPKGSLSAKLSARILARGMLGFSEAVNYAFMKKLTITPIGQIVSCVEETICNGCGRDLSVFFKSVGRVCRKCGITFCTRCSVKLQSKRTEMMELYVCLQCVVETHQISSWKFACERIHRNELPNDTDRLKILIYEDVM